MKQSIVSMEKGIYLTIFVFVAVYADNTPVLIWSPSRSMSDMPESYIGHKVDAEKFQDKYLQPLTSDPKNNLVVFLQNRLSIEDFTNHADVYNPSSEGGVFKNVKSAMEDDFSVQLPSVADPMSSIDKLKDEAYKGDRVIKVDNSEDLAKLELADGKGYLILVDLKPVGAADEAKTFKENDMMMGRCMHHLHKRGVKYTALYTAHTSAKREAEEDFQARHLMAADDAGSDDPVFFQDKNVMMSLRYADLTVSMPGGAEKPNKFLPGNATRFNATSLQLASSLVPSNITNTTYLMKMELSNDGGKLTLNFILGFNYANESMSSEGNITYEGSKPYTTPYSFDKVPADFKILFPYGFNFHCSQLYPRLIMKNYNNTNHLTIDLQLNGFQLEAYTNITDHFNDSVWDCVEFFTIPIWMGIISSLILVIIVFFALTMVANITTMDRFDDPKGKPLVITLNE